MLRKGRKKGVSEFGNNSCLVTWLFSMGELFMFQAQPLLFTKSHKNPNTITKGQDISHEVGEQSYDGLKQGLKELKNLLQI